MVDSQIVPQVVFDLSVDDSDVCKKLYTVWNDQYLVLFGQYKLQIPESYWLTAFVSKIVFLVLITQIKNERNYILQLMNCLTFPYVDTCIQNIYLWKQQMQRSGGEGLRWWWYDWTLQRNDWSGQGRRYHTIKIQQLI